MNGPDETLRQFVAAEHGLDARAAKLVTGSTLTELEANAAALAELIGEREHEPAAAGPGPFPDMATAKAERKRALAAIFTGRVAQPRDERGRFATDFSRGARQTVPQPPESHEQTLTRLLRTRPADAGRFI
jgi:hypothetical protein